MTESILISHQVDDLDFAVAIKQAIDECFSSVAPVKLLLEPDALAEGGAWLDRLDRELYDSCAIVAVYTEATQQRVSLDFAMWLAQKRGKLALTLRHANGDADATDKRLIENVIEQLAARLCFASPISR